MNLKTLLAELDLKRAMIREREGRPMTRVQREILNGQVTCILRELGHRQLKLPLDQRT